MLKREAVKKALRKSWVKCGGPKALNAQADAIMELLPNPEEIGRAVKNVHESDAFVLEYGGGCTFEGTDDDLGRAILEELRKEDK